MTSFLKVKKKLWRKTEHFLTPSKNAFNYVEEMAWHSEVTEMITQHRMEVTREISKVSWISALMLVINVHRHIWKLVIKMLHMFQKQP